MSTKTEIPGCDFELRVSENMREWSSPHHSQWTKYSAEATEIPRNRTENHAPSSGERVNEQSKPMESNCPRSWRPGKTAQLGTSQLTSSHRASSCRHTTILLTPGTGYQVKSVPEGWNSRHVRVRRVTTLEDVTVLPSSRSLKRIDKYSASAPTFVPSARYCKRKIVAILENEANTPLKIGEYTTPKKSSNRDTVPSTERFSAPSQNLSRLSVIKKGEKEPKLSTKIKREEKNVLSTKINCKSKISCEKKISSKPNRLASPYKSGGPSILEHANISPIKTIESKKCPKQNIENDNLPVNRTITKIVKAHEKPKHCVVTSTKITAKQKCTKTQKMYSDVQPKVDTMLKKKLPKETKVTDEVKKSKSTYLRNTSEHSVTSASHTETKQSDFQLSFRPPRQDIHSIVNNDISRTSQSEPAKPETKNQTTETSPEWVFPKDRMYDTREIEIQTEQMNLGELQLPPLTLTKESKDNTYEDITENISIFTDNTPLPNLQIPPVKISPRGKLKDTIDGQINRNASIIIGKATVTYTKKKKINFKVLGATEPERPISPATPLYIPSYPFTVMNVLKKELDQKKKNLGKQRGNENKRLSNWPEDLFLKSTAHLKQKKLLKPSDIIQNMQDASSILHADYLSDQFQKELNFIDSFFDSLQYLENNCVIVNNTSSNTYDKDLDLSFDTIDSSAPPNYDLMSKFLQGDGDAYTLNEMNASKSLCLLNFLIKDERRRAKNLVLILKMREDALKDFTKSQILYLENKKRSEEDVSTLKKKQRGALLKLQQECGEMQRMKKALLALSERRKDALIQTRRNIRLKLTTGLPIHRSLRSSKKKLPRQTTSNTCMLPIKCFDISESSIGADGSMDSRDTIIKASYSTSDTIDKITVTRIEKGIQTADSLGEETLESPVNASLDRSPHHLIKVDGAYLNILFHNLALPEMFSGGKEYEVNEGALQNILKSADRLRETTFRSLDSHIDKYKLEKSVSKSSSPSTARSLVDEFDEYFNYLGRPDEPRVDDISEEPERKKDIAVDTSDIDDYCKQFKAEEDNTKLNSQSSQAITEDEKTQKNQIIQVVNVEKSKKSDSSTNKINNSEAETIRTIKKKSNIEIRSKVTELERPSVSPVGSPRELISVLKRENVIRSIDSLKTQLIRPSKQDSSTSTAPCVSGLDDLPMRNKTLSPLSEEEELHKKQLAIELEIKALEQQFIVREIPDKPPPPYTPPTTEATGTQTSALPVVEFTTTNQRITRAVHTYCDQLYPPVDTPDVSNLRPADSLEELLLDFCTDSMKNYKVENSDEPWHASNLLPPKLTTNKESVKKALTDEAFSILGLSDKPAPLPGPPILNKRSDYIDDILFAEWRKCEVEWTALEADEVNVKNQLFKSIFDKIINESIDEYKQLINESNEQSPPH